MKELFFIEFLYALKEGKKLRQLHWKDCYIQLLVFESQIIPFYLKQTSILPNKSEEYRSYQLSGDEIFSCRWVEFTEDK